jgi:hypothetical protein
MYRRRTAVCLASVLVILSFGLRPTPTSASIFRPCHDDSSLPHTWGSHGNPNKGLVGAENGDHGYYYLSIKAGCGGGLLFGQQLVGKVHLVKVVKGRIDSDGMCWRLDISPNYNHTHKLILAVLMGTDVTLTYTRGVLGNDYRLRVANLEPGLIVTDRGSFDG